MLCSLATKLDAEQIEEIEMLAKDIGAPVLAFSCHEMEAAPIGAPQIDKLRNLESKLGVALVAVKQ